MTSPVVAVVVVAVVDDGDGVGVGGGFNDGREERLSRRALGSFLLNNLSLRLRVRVWDVFGGSSTTSIRSKDPLLCCKNSAGMVIILSLSRSLSLLRWRTRRMRFCGGQRGPYKSRFGGKKCLLSKINSHDDGVWLKQTKLCDTKYQTQKFEKNRNYESCWTKTAFEQP